MAIFASRSLWPAFLDRKTSLVLGTATVNLVDRALAIQLTISKVELVFALLTL
jgi:hypothetical protein